MSRNYYGVREWLESFIPLVYSKENLGLARIKYLLKLLGNPQEKFKSIHVAGTSGKGSTAFYIAKLLSNCKLETRNSKLETNNNFQNTKYQKVSDFGFRYSNFRRPKVGLHVSPHLVDIRERMQINGKLIKLTKFIKLIEQIRQVVEKIQREKPDLTPSYFEILVAASFLYFAQEKVDWAVVEVGLGGRLDATNVLTPEVSVITNVGLDHTDILGKTAEKIAYEKAGIIKQGVPVVTGTTLRLVDTRSGSQSPRLYSGSSSGRALQVIADVARERQAPLITVDTQKNQNSNQFLALAAVRAVGVKVGQEAVEAAFRAKFAGRLEEIDKGVILDGAHNPDKIRFLIEWTKNSQQLTVNSKLILVLAFKRGKDWKKMIDLLMKEFQIKNIIATKFNAVTDTGKFAAVEPGEIARYVKSVYRLPTTVYSNSQEAVFEAINSSVIAIRRQPEKQSDDKIASSSSTPRNDKRVILVTGSLYLVGEVRTMWKLQGF